MQPIGASKSEAPWQLGARALAERIARGELSAVDAVEAHIARIEEVNPSLNAVVWKRYDDARAEAAEADRRRAAGEPLGPLHGVPITIKECLDLAGSPSTFGVPALREQRATADEPHVARLRAAGAIVLGKTNVAQCLFFLESDNPLYGRSNHPDDATRTPGGSSGGQAAIIAAGGSPFGLGTDIGGSSRVPAAFCGIVGFKPTAGRMPDLGLGSIPVGQRAIPSQVGVMARTVEDVALALTIAARSDELPLRDPGAVEVAKLRVGYFADDGLFTPSAAYRRAIDEAAEKLRRRGAQVVALDPPPLRDALELFFRLLSADRLEGMGRFLGKAPRVPQIKQLEQVARMPRVLRPLLRVLLRASGRAKALEVIELCSGPYTADAYWSSCARLLDYEARWRRALDQQKLDLVLAPPTGLPALKHGASVELGVMGCYSILWNVLGWPAGVVPMTQVRPDEETATPRGKDVLDRTAVLTEKGSAGLPIAVQLAARPWREDQLLAVMSALHDQPYG